MTVNVFWACLARTCEDAGVRAEGFVQVWSTSSLPESEIARARLEDEGIPVMAKGEGSGPYRMGPVHLWVPAELEGRARAILDEPLEPISDEELAELAERAGEDPDAPEHEDP